jgi:hypothetical protein
MKLSRKLMRFVGLTPCLLAGLIGDAVPSSGATIGTSSWLQVNLSFMPFNYYDTSHSAASYGFSNGSSSSCPSGATVRGCFQTFSGI